MARVRLIDRDEAQPGSETALGHGADRRNSMKLPTTLLLAGSVAAGVMASTPALAVKAFATVHLNIRTGPGEQFPIAGEMRWNTEGEVSGCTADYMWCQISTANGIGWAAAHYLTTDTNRGPQTLESDGAQLGIPVVVPEEVTVVGAVTPVPAGTALIEAITPEDEVIEYVKANPVDPVQVTGEIVVGAILPAELVLYEIPSSKYQYVVVNGATVLVEPTSRKVVYIVR
jgi:uncharacterized protein YraI